MFEVRESNRLGRLSARLIDKVIEVNSGDPTVRQRFSVAHELGHHFLGTRHGELAGDVVAAGPDVQSVVDRGASCASPKARSTSKSRPTIDT